MIEDWTKFIVGIILIISPWVLGFSDISVAKWCNVLIGLLLVLVGVWEISRESDQSVLVAEEFQKRKRRGKNNVESK